MILICSVTVPCQFSDFSLLYNASLGRVIELTLSNG